MLAVLNRELGADFDLDAFEHVARYDAEAERMDIRLRSLADQEVRLDDLDLEISFAAGEEMRTEISTKFTRERLESVYAGAGLELRGWFTDAAGDYALSASPAACASSGRHLLGDAVDVAAAEQDLARRARRPPRARGSSAREDRRRLVVVALVEQRHDDPRVGEVEVDVGGGEAVAGPARLRPLGGVDPGGLLGASSQRAGGGEEDDLERAAAGVGRRFEPLARVARDRVLGVGLVVGPGQQHDPGPGEAGEVVDVAVGLVLEDAGAEPDDLLGAEVVEQAALDLLAARAPGCGCGLSRHSSVVSTVPSPSTWIEPPSSTSGAR